MPCEVIWKSDGVWIHGEGVLSVEQLKNAIIDIQTSEQFISSKYSVLDILDVDDLQINVAHVLQITKLNKSVVDQRRNTKLGFVVNQPEFRPLIRIYAWEMSDIGRDSYVFEDRESAQQWLDQD